MYGQQECRMTRDEISSHWEEVMTIINNIEARNERFLWIGDLNRHMGDKIPGNSDKVTYGGELLKQFLESDKYVLLNSTEKVTGGPWTRTNPADEESKSVLDLAIVSKELYYYVEEMKIDSEKVITPFKIRKDGTRSYSDHCAVVVKFKRSSSERKKSKSWR